MTKRGLPSLLRALRQTETQRRPRADRGHHNVRGQHDLTRAMR
jgi:hypothetical protein